MWKAGFADVVFTEDSDLLAFGVEKVFFKMDNMGNGQEIQLKNIKKIKEFKNMSKEMFITSCILSGCDYLESIKGVGLQKALKLVNDCKEEDGSIFLQAMTMIREENKLKIPRKYERHYKKAYLTFKF